MLPKLKPRPFVVRRIGFKEKTSFPSLRADLDVGVGIDIFALDWPFNLWVVSVCGPTIL